MSVYGQGSTTFPVRNLQPRAKTPFPLSPHHAPPSPLNGERAGVRGVTNSGVPEHPTSNSQRSISDLRLALRTSNLAPPSTPHPGPLDRGGEGARADRGVGSGCRPRSAAPARSALNADTGGRPFAQELTPARFFPQILAHETRRRRLCPIWALVGRRSAGRSPPDGRLGLRRHARRRPRDRESGRQAGDSTGRHPGIWGNLAPAAVWGGDDERSLRYPRTEVHVPVHRKN